MSDLAIELLSWQAEVYNDPARFKIVAAGRRCGKSRLAAWVLILSALNDSAGETWYVAPTQGQARDIMWKTLHDLIRPYITSSHINNLQITLINGQVISLKGADRPDTMRGVSLKTLVMDEYADMKDEVFDQILRPALADQQGQCLFIGTPKGRNHFYKLWEYGNEEDDEDYSSYHFTSYDNPLLERKEIEAAKRQMSSFAFRQEFMASFMAAGSEIFENDWIKYSSKEPDTGDYYIAIDLAGFDDGTSKKSKRLDQTAISVVKVGEYGWWVCDIQYGRWGVKETAQKIFDVVARHRPVSIGIEQGALQKAVLPYLSDVMRANNKYFHIETLRHGNKSKTDRIVWALQGRFEHGKIRLNKADWNDEFVDQLMSFPTPLVHDDLIDSLAYIDQMAVVNYDFGGYLDDTLEFIDNDAGY